MAESLQVGTKRSGSVGLELHIARVLQPDGFEISHLRSGAVGRQQGALRRTLSATYPGHDPSFVMAVDPPERVSGVARNLRP